VLGTSPAIFGMAAASWMLCNLASAPFLPEPIFTICRPQYETILEGLQEDEERIVGHCDDIAVDLEEVMHSESSDLSIFTMLSLTCKEFQRSLLYSLQKNMKKAKMA
jgi:hypothetical protein